MKAPLIWKKQINGMVPTSHAAQDWFSKTPLGKEVIMDARRPRNVRHHRLYWALLSIVAENSDYSTAEEVHYIIKACLHHGRWVEVRGAKRPLFIADSTNFVTMGQDQFSEFYRKAIRIAQTLLPKDAAGNPISVPDLEEAITNAA